MSSTKLLAVSALATAVLAATYFSLSSKPATSIGDLSEDDLGCSVDEIVSMFEEMHTSMRACVERLMKMIQQIKAQGMQIPEEQLAAHLVGEYEKELAGVEETVYGKYGVDREDFEEAVSWYMENKVRSLSLLMHAL
jgi:hypothetical protein